MDQASKTSPESPVITGAQQRHPMAAMSPMRKTLADF